MESVSCMHIKGEKETYKIKKNMPSLTKSFMYLLGCHRLVAWYMSIDCLKVRETARTRSWILRMATGNEVNGKKPVDVSTGE